MMKTILFILSTQLLSMKNHMKILLTIVISCLFMSTLIFFMKINHWFSIMIVLMYISGIMVLFMFVVSLAPNEKYMVKTQKNFLIFIVMNLMMVLYKPLNSMTNSKTNSLFKYSIIPLMMCTMVILIMAYLPPKMIKSFYKGMKSSK